MAHYTVVHEAKTLARQLHDNEKFAHYDAVASILAIISAKPEMVAAAYLLESGRDFSMLMHQFGFQVADLVDQIVTDIPELTPDAQTILLADIFGRCIDLNDDNFDLSYGYLLEKARIADKLQAGDPFLYTTVRDYITMKINKLKSRP